MTQLWSKGSVRNPVTLHRVHPLSRKIFSRGIGKCPGCKEPLSTTIEGYNEEDDKEYCFGYFEAYNFWNKSTKRHQITTSTQHYHLNPVCTKVRQSEGTLKISTWNVQVSHHLHTKYRSDFHITSFKCRPEIHCMYIAYFWLVSWKLEPILIDIFLKKSIPR